VKTERFNTKFWSILPRAIFLNTMNAT